MESKDSYPPQTKGKYQVLGWMREDQFRALKRSIAAAGRVNLAVVKDDVGETLDGFHRLLAVEQLNAEGRKIPPPAIQTEIGLSEEGKRHTALDLNLCRRVPSPKERRTIIAAELRHSPDINDKWMAEICGSTDKTVRSVREELERMSEIPTLTEFRRRGGKKYPRNVISHTPKEAQDVREAIDVLRSEIPKGPLNAKRLRKAAIRKQAKEKKLAASPSPLPAEGEPIRLYPCPFQQVEAVARLEPNSVNLVLTDFPYNKEWLATGQLLELAELAERILVPGGLFVSYTGSLALNTIMRQIEEGGLSWGYVAKSVWTGFATQLHARQVISKSKLILIFSKGPWRKLPRYWHDTLHVESREKTHHKWQQPLEEAERLVWSFSNPGDLVVDPCGGSFTNAVACERLGRRFVGCDRDAAMIPEGLKRLEEERLDAPSLSVPDLDDLSVPRKSVRFAWMDYASLRGRGNEDFFWDCLDFLKESLHPTGTLAIIADNQSLPDVYNDFVGPFEHCCTLAIKDKRSWKPVVLLSKEKLPAAIATARASFGELEDEMSLLASLVEEGDTVLNFGSNTLAAACTYMGLECVGWARDAEKEQQLIEQAKAEMRPCYIAPFTFSNVHMNEEERDGSANLSL